MTNIKPGDIIKGNQWSEPVEIKLVEENEKYFHILGVTINSRKFVDQIILREELSNISVLSTESIFSEEPWKVFLSLEATRYRFASLYDPLLAMNISKIDPLPHQIEAVYGYVLKMPQIRFLIADDPGAGKTIMAGLIIKELKLRNLIKNILIVVPGHLKDQWIRELKDRFEEKFLKVDRNLLYALYGENIWMRENQIITSIDFIKREDILPSISASHFDLIIVDEAHKMSAYLYANKTKKTARYKIGEILSRNSEHFLMLTATPHKGDPENFRLFLDLLKPGFFATTKMIYESIKNKDNPLFIRRIKEDLKDFEGKPLFLPRHVITKTFSLSTESPKEADLYTKLSKYVIEQYNKAMSKNKKRNITFALIILQRRLASSTFALLRSLERRKKRLEDLLKEGLQKNLKYSEDFIDFDEIEDMSEEERWKEEEIWETLSVAKNREELEEEINTIKYLIEDAKDVIINEDEIKLKELKNSLAELSKKYSEHKDKKIVIFTESRDTLEYLKNKIKGWGYTINVIHGGMNLEDRIKAEKIFKNETQILVATEAAGEGINLQFCHLMINYDIPWNPNRIEQRMGRIHRYGQQKEVYVFNLVAGDTREGRVFKKLFEKLEEIKRALGSDKVFDCLGEIYQDKNLSQLLLEAAVNARNIDDILKDIEITVNEEYIKKVKENLGESLATRFIDYTRIKEMAQQAQEYRLIPEYTESFFKKAFAKVGGKFHVGKDDFLIIDSIPFDLRNIAKEDTFKKSYGDLVRKYPRVTFDKEIAFRNPDVEFISFGHSLFESLMIWIERNISDSLLNGANFIDPDGNLDGYILFYEGEVKDGNDKIVGKRLFSFYTNGKDLVKEVSPAIIWDLAEGANIKNGSIDIKSIKEYVFNNIISTLEEYKKELLQERLRQIQIKQKYGVTSLDYLLVKLDGELISLERRKEFGENVDLVIRNKEERKEKYIKALEELKIQIEKEKKLTMSAPHFIGILRVKPQAHIDKEMVSNKEIELVGMKIAMDYEVKNGRKPEDVSAENLGFDIRSKDRENKIRYIEVKTRAQIGDVALTQNEWFKAKRFKDDYYLYVVVNSALKPKLYIVRNPVENLEVEQKVEVVRYIIAFSEIEIKGDEEIE
ncbi:MAG: DUF3883 domain-containing protein [Actinobacteria bacterium]|nr:DUF3883 domain-containing protein [Actinomycetota bacterium]